MLPVLVRGVRAAPSASYRLVSSSCAVGLAVPSARATWSAPLVRSMGRPSGSFSPAVCAGGILPTPTFVGGSKLCGSALRAWPAGHFASVVSRRVFSSSSVALAGPRGRPGSRRPSQPRPSASAERTASQAAAAAAEPHPSPPAAPAAPALLSFFSPTASSWEALWLDPAVCRALRSAGFARPSTVQALSAPEQLARRDLVLRAETGSGKTLAYLVPALNDLALWARLELARGNGCQSQGEEMGGGAGAVDRGEKLERRVLLGGGAGVGPGPELSNGPARPALPPSTLVLCANAVLCDQVEQVGAALGAALLRELEVEIGQGKGIEPETRHGSALVPDVTSAPRGPPRSTAVLPPELFAPVQLRSGRAPSALAPFVAVATPAGLDSWRESLRGLAGSGVPTWARADPSRWASRLVVDEADLLLGGSYGKAVDRVLEAFRIAEKHRREAFWESALGLSEGGLRKLPHRARQVLLERGFDAAKRQGLDAPRPHGASKGLATREARAEFPAKAAPDPAGEGSAGEGPAGEGSAGEGSAGEGSAGEGPAGEGSAGEGSAGEGPAGEGSAGEGPAGVCGMSMDASEASLALARAAISRAPDLLQTPLRRCVPVAFVGATIPTGSRRAVGDVILASHPTAAWVDGPEAHRAKSDIDMHWRNVESDSQRVFEILKSIAEGWKLDGEKTAAHADEDRKAATALARLPHVTLVFCRDATSARETCAALREALEGGGAEVVLHDGGGRDGGARLAAALRGRRGEVDAAMGAGDRSGGDAEVPSDRFLVEGADRGESERDGEPEDSALSRPPLPTSRVVIFSTDAAARGLDSPSIRHVIQADFASSAVDFVHRVGRTGRAGRKGLATSLVGPADGDLADAIRESLERAQSLEGTFSRKRSFRKRVKKYGGFVPAGQSGTPSHKRT